MPIEECCILYLHHKMDFVTREHYRLLRENNPYPVIPLHTAQHEHLEGAFDVGLMENVWAHADLPYYAWFLRRNVEAKRYIWIEYDTHATQPLKEFYGNLWDAPAVGSYVRRRSHDRYWPWFREISKMPREFQPHAMGVSPISCVLLSHESFEKLATKPRPDVFCELRLGTSFNYHGIDVQPLPIDKAINIHWDANLLWYDKKKPGVYHPVKSL